MTVRQADIKDFERIQSFSNRRQGIGTEFFGGVKAFAMSKGAQSIELYVWSFNEPARKLYESLGMKPQRTLMELKL